MKKNSTPTISFYSFHKVDYDTFFINFFPNAQLHDWKALFFLFVQYSFRGHLCTDLRYDDRSLLEKNHDSLSTFAETILLNQ
jgi:hypothetical protein